MKRQMGIRELGKAGNKEMGANRKGRINGTEYKKRV